MPKFQSQYLRLYESYEILIEVLFLFKESKGKMSELYSWQMNSLPFTIHIAVLANGLLAGIENVVAHENNHFNGSRS